MPLNKYLDDGLDAFMLSNPKSTDAQLENEALRLEAEYNTQTAPQQNVERAKAMVANDPVKLAQLQAMQQGPEAFLQKIRQQGVKSLPYGDRYKSNITGKPRSATSAKILEATTPRIAQGMAQGDNFQPVRGIQDVASLPGRAYESAFHPSEFANRMSKTDGTGFVSEAIRSPYNVIPAMGGVGKIAGAPINKAMQYMARGAGEQLPSAMLEQASRIEEGRGVSPLEFGAEVASGALLPIGGKAAKRALFGVEGDFKKNGLSEVAKSALSGASGKSKELLSYIGADELTDGIKSMYKSNMEPSKKIDKIKNYSKNAEDVVGGIIDFIDNGFKDKFIESNGNVRHALKEMGDIDVSDIVLDLNRKKKAVLDTRDPLKRRRAIVPKGHRTGDESIDVRLDNYDKVIEKLTGSRYGEQRFTIPADQLYSIRKEIDKAINFDKTKFSTGLSKELNGIPQDVRNKLAEKLRKAGSETTFPKDMATFHDGINLADDLSKKFGDGSNVDKSARFLTTLGNPNKIESKILAAKLKKFLGKDLFEEANLLKLSKEYSDGLPIYNEIQTGRSMLAPVLGEKLAGKVGAFTGATLGSPKVAAPVMRGIEAVEGSADYMSPMVKKLLRSGISEQIGE